MVASATLTLPDARVSAPMDEGSIFFIGNATVLLRVAGFTVLTDPTFIHKHEQTWLGNGLHTTRLVDPAIELADLPPLDLVLLSHFHGDHFDQVAERDLDRSLPIVTTPQSANDLAECGFINCIPLETWDSLDVEKGEARLRITATPARHGPPLVDLVLPDVMGSILDVTTADGATDRLYITGDTLVIDELKEIPKRFPDIDIALLHLGGTRVLGILVSMDAKQGLEAMRIIDPALAIPIHYDDYDVFTSPLSDFREEISAAGLEDRVHYLRHGETYRWR
ncbi:MAG: putative metal-dependent hydrolase [Thermomicrobiales bacterium]|nr:putative metal-dependent hydrolase [Thermomicrobiales bacterium]